MARLNLEDRFFGDNRLHRVSKLMGWDTHKVIGAMVMLWHSSQELVAVTGSAEEIAAWAQVDDPEDAKNFVIALVKCRWVHEVKKDCYAIHGNESQIEWRKSQIDKSKRGGEANRVKISAANARNNSSREPTGYPASETRASPSISIGSGISISKEKEEGVGSAGSDDPSSADADPSPSLAIPIPIRPKQAQPKTPSATQLAALWNEERGNLPEVKALSKSRQRFAAARLREHPDLAYWRQVIEKVRASSFCSGTNNRGWRADFDFLVREGTHLKVLEGKYDDRGAGNSAINWDTFFTEAEAQA